MKKILTFIVAVIAMATTAQAQIKIDKSTTNRPKQVATLTPYWNWLNCHDGEYYISFKSDNQFDDIFILSLGKTRKECLESLESLQELMDNITKDDIFTIDNGYGRSFSATEYSFLGARGLTINSEGYAGRGYIYLSSIKKAIKWIEKNLVETEETETPLE
jgi:hypothetical protein